MRFARPVVVRGAAGAGFGALALLLAGLVSFVVVVIEGASGCGFAFALGCRSASLLVAMELVDLRVWGRYGVSIYSSCALLLTVFFVFELSAPSLLLA